MARPRFRIVPPRILPHVDWLALLLTAALVTMGVVTLWGATSGGEGPSPFMGVARRQAVFGALGLALMLGCVLMNYRWLHGAAWPLYGLLLISLVGLLIQMHFTKGARSWYNLGLFKIQPSEPGKIILALVLARYLSARILKFRGLRHTLAPLAIAGGPLLLVLVQPDLGTALVLVPMVAAMFWVAGLRKWVFGAAILAGLGVIFFGFHWVKPHLKPHQQQRIETFLNPTADPLRTGWQILQAQTTLGSGQLFGLGLGHGTQAKLLFLPQYDTDFIFPTLGEQSGFVGCALAIALLALLVGRMVQLARVTQDLFGVLLITA